MNSARYFVRGVVFFYLHNVFFHTGVYVLVSAGGEGRKVPLNGYSDKGRLVYCSYTVHNSLYIHSRMLRNLANCSV